MNEVSLIALTVDDREQFILDNQEAFYYGALEEFGVIDNHFEEDGEIIARKTIEKSIDGGIAYRILYNNEKVGGVVVGSVVNLNCCLFLLMHTIRVLDMLHGVKLKSYIQM